MAFKQSSRRDAEQYAKLMLHSHGITQSRGFLPSRDPLVHLPERYAKLFEPHLKLGEDMPKLTELGGHAYARRVLELPVLSGEKFSLWKRNDVFLRLAVTLSFLVQAYIWQDRHHPRRVLPAQLAVPAYALIGRALGVTPLLVYQFYTLANWQRIRADGPIAVENVRMIQNFNVDADGRRASEEWFVSIHVEIERIAGRALHAAFMLCHALASGNRDVVAECLCRIKGTLAKMERVLARMNERCDPQIYYEHVRPYLFGWFNVPGGVVYEGVSELFGGTQTWRGQTGAQSSVAPLLDALLCIPHNDPKLSEHLGIMLRDHTPRNHRVLVTTLHDSWYKRTMCWSKLLSEDDEINELYRQTRRALADFRRQHYDHALVYIAKPAIREHEASRVQGSVIIPGTGGSDLIKSLKLHVEDTLHPDERILVMSEYEEHWQKIQHSS